MKKTLLILVCLGVTVGCGNSKEAEAQKEAQNDAKNSVIKELNKMNSITEMGVNYQNYSTKLLDVKTEIDSLMNDISDEQFKTKAQEALQAYVDATTVWNNMITGYRGSDENTVIVEQINKYIEKYELGGGSLPRDDGTVGGFIPWEGALPKIWAIATLKTKEAKALIQ